MKGFVASIANNGARRRAFLRTEKDEIRRINLNAAFAVSVLTLALLALFALAAPLIMPDWTPSFYHWALFAIMAVYAVVVFCYRKLSSTKRLSTAFCLLLEAVIFWFTLSIDVVLSPNSPSTFMPLFRIIMPAVFIFPLWLIVGIAASVELTFCALVMLTKSPSAMQHDLFQSLMGVVLAVFAAIVTLNLRVRSHEVESHYRDLSMRDALSGIYNKQTFISTTRALVESGGASCSCSLAIIDMDDFKGVNDKHGHYVGDVMLREMGDLLRGNFRLTDVIGRFGGDEFVVFINGPISHETMRRKLESIQEDYSAYGSRLLDQETTCSTGAVIVYDEPVDFDELFCQADAALYESKQSGKDQTTLRPYHQPETSELGATRQNRVDLEKDVLHDEQGRLARLTRAQQAVQERQRLFDASKPAAHRNDSPDDSSARPRST